MILEVKNLNQSIIDQAIETLKNDGVIVYPTDTIYGLGCDIFSKKAIAKIYKIKKREKNKPFSIICADLANIAEFAIVPDYAFRLMKKYLPGPFTFILKASRKTPDTVISRNKTVGIRIPDSVICLELVKNLGNPIVTTSLNFSGEAVFSDPNDLDKELANQIDLILDEGPLFGDPSTIVDCSGDFPVIVRQGAGVLNI